MYVLTWKLFVKNTAYICYQNKKKTEKFCPSVEFDCIKKIIIFLELSLFDLWTFKLFTGHWMLKAAKIHSKSESSWVHFEEKPCLWHFINTYWHSIIKELQQLRVDSPSGQPISLYNWCKITKNHVLKVSLLYTVFRCYPPLYPRTATAMVSRVQSTYSRAMATLRAQSFLHLVHSVPSWIPATHTADHCNIMIWKNS